MAYQDPRDTLHQMWKRGHRDLFSWVYDFSGKQNAIEDLFGAQNVSVEQAPLYLSFLKMASPELREYVLKTAGHVPICSHGLYNPSSYHPGVQVVRWCGEDWARLVAFDEHLVNWAANRAPLDQLDWATPNTRRSSKSPKLSLFSHSLCPPCFQKSLDDAEEDILKLNNPAL